MIKMIVLRLFISLVFFILAAFFFSAVVYMKKENETLRETLTTAVNRMGYTQAEILPRSSPDEWKHIHLQCASHINGVYISQARAVAFKKGQKRKLVLCFNNDQVVSYDIKEEPFFPLWTTKKSAIETYKLNGNNKAVEKILQYNEIKDTQRNFGLTHPK